MTETYSKLTNIQLLSQKDIEGLNRIQQQIENTMETYNDIKRVLAPALAQFVTIQKQQREMLQPVISTLKKMQQIQESLKPTLEAIANTLGALDIPQNPDIIQQPASNFFDQELLEEIPRTLHSLESEVSELPESDKILEIIVFLQSLFINCDITIDKIMFYVEFIQFIFSILGVNLPVEEPSQVNNFYGDINIIQIEDYNDIEIIIEQINDLNE